MFRYALRFITYDKPKSIGVILGIVISTFLVGQQTGIFLFLTGAMSSLVTNTQADIWVVDDQTTNANALGLIDVRVGRQVESIPGVRQTFPLVITGGTAKFQAGQSQPVALVGLQAPAFRGGPWGIDQGDLASLMEEGAVSVECFERKNLNNAGLGSSFEINGRRVFVALVTKGVRGFGGNYVFTTIDRARALSQVSPTKTNAFLVDVEEGQEPARVRDRINDGLTGVRAWTKDEFARTTVSTVLATSGIALSIGTLIIFATLAGMIIIGLTMYSAAVDRLRDYGTLKAIGADNSYVRRLIMIQALFFGLTGYGISIILVEGFRMGIAKSGVIFRYSPAIKAAFFAVTILIALGGALFAMRRLSRLEPASVFRR